MVQVIPPHTHTHTQEVEEEDQEFKASLVYTAVKGHPGLPKASSHNTKNKIIKK